MILYPAIDIRDGKAVRLLRGDYEHESVYDADPAAAARRWVEGGARFLHVVDLDGAREGRPVNLGSIERVASVVDVPVQVGGGLRSEDAIEVVLEAGAERVVLGTAAMRDPELLRAALQAHGERVVVGVDTRSGRVALEGWTEIAGADAAGVAAELSDEGVKRFVFTPIEVDGTMEGPDIEQLQRFAAATEADVIYSGGIGKLADLRLLATAAPPNLVGVIVGRALYEGRFSVADADAELNLA